MDNDSKATHGHAQQDGQGGNAGMERHTKAGNDNTDLKIDYRIQSATRGESYE
jgi:hypothetical protein